LSVLYEYVSIVCIACIYLYYMYMYVLLVLRVWCVSVCICMYHVGICLYLVIMCMHVLQTHVCGLTDDGVGSHFLANHCG